MPAAQTPMKLLTKQTLQDVNRGDPALMKSVLESVFNSTVEEKYPVAGRNGKNMYFPVQNPKTEKLEWWKQNPENPCSKPKSYCGKVKDTNCTRSGNACVRKTGSQKASTRSDTDLTSLLQKLLAMLRGVHTVVSHTSETQRLVDLTLAMAELTTKVNAILDDSSSSKTAQRPLNNNNPKRTVPQDSAATRTKEDAAAFKQGFLRRRKREKERAAAAKTPEEDQDDTEEDSGTSDDYQLDDWLVADDDYDDDEHAQAIGVTAANYVPKTRESGPAGDGDSFGKTTPYMSALAAAEAVALAPRQKPKIHVSPENVAKMTKMRAMHRRLRKTQTPTRSPTTKPLEAVSLLDYLREHNPSDASVRAFVHAFRPGGQASQFKDTERYLDLQGQVTSQADFIEQAQEAGRDLWGEEITMFTDNVKVSHSNGDIVDVFYEHRFEEEDEDLEESDEDNSVGNHFVLERDKYQQAFRANEQRLAELLPIAHKYFTRRGDMDSDEEEDYSTESN